MTASANAVFDLNIKANVINSLDLGSGAIPQVIAYKKALTSGTGSSQIDTVWGDQRSAAASADTLDLQGSLTNALGATVTFAEVVGIVIVNESTTTAENLIIGAGSNPWITWLNATGDAVKLGPGGVFLLTSPIDGYATTATTGDILTIDPGASTITYSILIVGRSA